MATQRSIVWVDANGKTTQTLPRGSASLLTLQGTLKSNSNADVQQSFEGPVTVNGAPAPVAAVYETVADKAKFLYQTASGTIVTLFLPAPLANLFLADGRTINPSSPGVIAINAAALAVLVDPAGSPITTFIGGVRE